METPAPFRLTLLGPAPCTALLRPALAQALCRLEIPAVQLPAAGDGVCATFKRDDTGTEQAAPLTLLARESTDLPTMDNDGRLLLMAGTRTSELERAYLFCKQLLASRHAALPGITLSGCCRQDQAEQCFYQLANAVRRFLGKPLLSYAYLPPLEPDLGAWHRQIQHLATLIATDWHEHHASSTATTTDRGRT